MVRKLLSSWKIKLFDCMKDFEFKIEATDEKTRARAGVLKTPHGEIETPIFMPVGTAATVKTLAPEEVEDLGAQIILGNTYHLYLRPGHELIGEFGGIHGFMKWDKPILTDSGGFQVFSLGLGNEGGEKLTKIKEDGVEFRSFLDGSKHFFTPRKVMEIEAKLGADIIMAFDECAPATCSKSYAREAMERTHRWALECKAAQKEVLHWSGKVSSEVQGLFPIVQGAVYDDLRVESAKFMSELDLPGVAIGGLAVGEPEEEMYRVLEVVEPHLPKDKPRYLMGVGTPRNLVECVARGVDMFDCVLATRLARHGTFWAHSEDGKFEKFNIRNQRFKDDAGALDGDFTYGPIKKYSRAYLRHLIMAKEVLGIRILSLNNLYVLLNLMERVRKSIKDGSFESLRRQYGL